MKRISRIACLRGPAWAGRQAAMLFCTIMMLLAAAGARAQGSRKDGIVFGARGVPVAGATVAVCTEPANTATTPCAPLAALYTDTTMTTVAANPFTTDGLGNYHFYAAPGRYTIQFYGPGVNPYVMADVILPSDPSSSTSGNNISAFTLTLGGNLSVGGSASVAGALSTGSFNPSAISTSTLSVSGSNTLAASGNTQLKPQTPALTSQLPGATSQEILYVSPAGNDSNDGLSWGTAKLTFYAAWEALPASFSGRGPGGGELYIAQGTACGGPLAAQGCWIMNSGDPGFNLVSSTAGSISRAANVVTVTCTAAVTYTVSEAITVHSVDNADFDGNFTVASVSGSTFTYSQAGANESSQFGAVTPEGWLISKAVKVHGVSQQGTPGTDFANEPAAVLTTTLSSTSTSPAIWLSEPVEISFDHIAMTACVPFAIGEGSDGDLNNNGAASVFLTNSVLVADTGSASCGPTVTIGSNVLWFWQSHDSYSANNAAALTSDNRAAVLLNGGTGAHSSSGDNYIENVNIVSAGGIKLHGSSMPGSWGMVIKNVTEESNGVVTSQPVVWIADSNCAGAVYVDNANQADQPTGSMPAVENDSTCSADQFQLGPNVGGQSGSGSNALGPALELYPLEKALIDTVTPPVQHRFGFWGAQNSAIPHLAAQMDDSRRALGPSAVRYANLMDQGFVTGWTFNGTKTTGITDLAGGTSAIELTSSSGSQYMEWIQPTALSYAVGDWVIGGIFVKPHAVGQAFPNDDTAGGCIGHVGDTNSMVLGTSWPASSGNPGFCPPVAGDGKWEFIPFAAKVTTAPSPSTSQVEITYYVDTTHPADFYAPIMIHIPTGTVSDSEALEMMQDLRTYAASCAVGTLCTVAGVNLSAPAHINQLAANGDLAGTVTLSAGAATKTFSTAYGSAPVCTATDTTAANAVKVSTTATAATFAGTTTDVIAYICIGNPN